MEKKEERPWCMITEMDQYLFGQGTHYEIYKKLGAHLTEYEGEKGVYFAVWAPHAKGVRVVGEFNCWGSDGYRMNRLEPLGIYEVFVPGLEEGCMYKYLIETEKGDYLYKADPFAFYAEKRPGTASRVADISGFTWHDDRWMTKRAGWNAAESPMSIYEVHPGSWKRHPHEEDEDGFYNYRELSALLPVPDNYRIHPHEEDEDGFYNYRELAVELTEYIKKMGYTHIELMGIAEHPFDGSWGYQVTGYFAPTSRYGTPEDFQYMIDYFHKHNIGVILDWVPAHFPRDAHGLANFDGEALYEHPDSRRGEHPDWGTKIFNYEKSEVRNFLIANALFWLGEYHVDGLRVDAVASMLYLDYGKQDGQWLPNKYGGNENLDAVWFFKHLNSIIHGRGDGSMIIAEESTAWPGVTKDVDDGGLGFTFKWNMGWMNDFLEYMKLDPYFRKDNHNKMTFAMSYAYSENYILVLSHDEVVHLKCSMLNKMPGYLDDKFANLKAGYTFMFGHPGKKLLFMGNEFAQLQEWSEARELDWFLLKEDRHLHMQNYVRALLQLYKKYRCLYELDDSWDGFQWINADDSYRSIFSFVRYSKTKRKNLLFVMNFTPMERPDYRVGVPKKKKYELVLDSDAEEYGGSGRKRAKVYDAKKGSCDNQKYYVEYPLSAYGTAVFEF